jgi:hypothetical protein
MQIVTSHIFAELPKENNLQVKLWNRMVEEYIIIKILTQMGALKIILWKLVLRIDILQ